MCGTELGCVIPLLTSILLSSAWALAGGWKFTEDRASVFAVLTVVTLLVSVLSVYRMTKVYAIPSSVHTTGKVITNREWGKRRAIIVDTQYGKFAAYINSHGAPEEGAVISLRGAVFDFKRARPTARGGFDEYLYWRSKGAVKKIAVLEMKIIGEPTGIYRWRNFLSERIKYILPFNMSGYMLALTTGERDRQLAEIHRITGTSHLLAVSGFHVGILAGLVSLLFRKGKKRVVCVTVLMWLYVMFAGFPASGIRAALMVQVYLLGLLLGRPSSAFNSVSVAGVILLLYDPWVFFDIGWQLSMLAALTMSAISPLARPLPFKAAVASIAVWLVTAPVVASVFKTVTADGILINIFAIPLFSILFPLVMIFSIPALVGLPFGNLAADFMEYHLEAWEYFSEIAEKYFSVNVPFSYYLLAVSIVLFSALASYASGIRGRRLLFTSAIFSLSALLIITML